jgi:hypothetical protein
MQNCEEKKSEKKWKSKILWAKQTSFLAPCPFNPWAVLTTRKIQELLKKYRKNELKTCFEQNFTTGSYRVEIGRAWCSQKACEICSSLV